MSKKVYTKFYTNTAPYTFITITNAYETIFLLEFWFKSVISCIGKFSFIKHSPVINVVTCNLRNKLLGTKTGEENYFLNNSVSEIISVAQMTGWHKNRSRILNDAGTNCTVADYVTLTFSVIGRRKTGV